MDLALAGYLALRFIGLPWFLMIPWQQADAVLRRQATSDADGYINVDKAECLGALAEFWRDLGT
jgi:hypothetical protein